MCLTLLATFQGFVLCYGFKLNIPALNNSPGSSIIHLMY